VARHGVHRDAAAAERQALIAVDRSLRARPDEEPTAEGKVEEVEEGDREVDELLQDARGGELGLLYAGMRTEEVGGGEFGALAINALPELLHGLRDRLAGVGDEGDAGRGPLAEDEPREAVTRICRRLHTMRTMKGIPADHIMQILLVVSQELNPLLAYAGMAPEEWPQYWRGVAKRYRLNCLCYRFEFKTYRFTILTNAAGPR
jgi:hypothetical protein